MHTILPSIPAVIVLNHHRIIMICNIYVHGYVKSISINIGVITRVLMMVEVERVGIIPNPHPAVVAIPPMVIRINQLVGERLCPR